MAGVLLEILYRVSADRSLEEREPGASSFDDRLENVHCVLFALIVSQYAYLYLSVVTEVLVVVHLAGEEGIGLHT